MLMSNLTMVFILVLLSQVQLLCELLNTPQSSGFDGPHQNGTVVLFFTSQNFSAL
jgi:hypothetical protein